MGKLIEIEDRKFRDEFALSYASDRIIIKANEILKIILSRKNFFSIFKNWIFRTCNVVCDTSLIIQFICIYCKYTYILYFVS